MEAECASYWCSVDAICEESEMIASLQSLLWSSSDVDLVPGLCSSNVPYCLPGSSPFSISDNEKSTLVSSNPNEVLGTPALAHGEKVVGSKRKAMDEEKNHGSEGRTATPSAPKARKRSKANSQSCYAKKRRDRINARLKILQELIPNGKKVDISTMLDEAVQYVKFLHRQIKGLKTCGCAARRKSPSDTFGVSFKQGSIGSESFKLDEARRQDAASDRSCGASEDTAHAPDRRKGARAGRRTGRRARPSGRRGTPD